MVYIDRHGRVCERRPWDLGRVIGLFTGLWFIIVYFFKTLFAPFGADNRNERGGRNWSSGGGGGGGGGGFGGGGGGGSSGGGGYRGGGLRPNRNIGRITNSMDCNMPAGGG